MNRLSCYGCAMVRDGGEFPTTAVSTTAASTSAGLTSAGLPGIRDWFTKPIIAGIILFVLYFGLSFFNSPRGFLGTDTGGKVATLIVMSEQGEMTPEVGYWAAEWDPDARVHGLYYTSVVNGHYVNVTSLPMILAAEPLWQIGGYRLALVFPMLGAIAAAFAAREIARRISTSSGWAAFWLVGLASPMAIYALDFWEHTVGVALMVWAAVLLMDAVTKSNTVWRGLGAGLLLGAAFAMRSEAATYAMGFVIVAVAARFVTTRDRLHSLAIGVTAVIGFAVVTLANFGLEKVILGGTIRASRAAGTVGAGGSYVTLRLKEAVITSFSPFPASDAASLLLAFTLACAIAYLVWGSIKNFDQRGLFVVAGLIGVLYLVRLASGLGFVPGLVAASPIAVAGVVWGWVDKAAKIPVLLAVVPLPLVFAFQFPGGAAPQWAGRYILASGLILAAVGTVSLPSMDRWVAVLFVTTSIVVTSFGLVWLSVRSHDIARSADLLESRPEDVLISPNGFVPREFGGTYGQKRWLAAGCTTALSECEDLSFAVDVARESGAKSFAIVSIAEPDQPPSFDGWAVVGPTEMVSFVGGTQLAVITYSRQDST